MPAKKKSAAKKPAAKKAAKKIAPKKAAAKKPAAKKAAKKPAAKKAAKKKAVAPGHKHTFADETFDCHGIRTGVKGNPGGNVPRMFCTNETK